MINSNFIKDAITSKKILLLLACLAITSGFLIMADPLDSTQIQSLSDSVVIHPATTTIDVSGDWWSFVKSIMASVIAAIIAMVLFFSLLRPKIQVAPIVAIEGSSQKNHRLICGIAVKNRSFFACNDLRIKVCKLMSDENDNESITKIIDENFLSIGGRLRNENESVHSIQFGLEPERIPKQILVSVIAQHSLSGIIKGKYIYKNGNDFKFGHYEKGVFVPRGNNYLQVQMRRNVKYLKRVFVIAVMLFALLLLVSLYMPQMRSFCSPWKICMTYILICILAIGLWQLFVFSKSQAYNTEKKNIQLNNLNFMVVNNRNNDSQTQLGRTIVEAEDVKPEDEPEKIATTDTPK